MCVNQATNLLMKICCIDFSKQIATTLFRDREMRRRILEGVQQESKGSPRILNKRLKSSYIIHKLAETRGSCHFVYGEYVILARDPGIVT